MQRLDRYLNNIPGKKDLPDLNLWSIPQGRSGRSLDLTARPLVQETGDSGLDRLFASLRANLEPLRPALIGCWIHGSLATGDYTGYSDADLLLIVRDAAIRDREALRTLRQGIRRALAAILYFDHLQHHGFFIAPESLLQRWPVAFLPVAALQFARAFWTPTGPADLTEAEYHETAPSECLRMIAAILKAVRPRTLYDAKLLLSQFMLLPALYYQARGEPMYKRDSFPRAREEFKAVWRPMQEATELRAAWRRPQRPFFRLFVSIANPWQISRVYRQFERNLPDCASYPDWGHFLDGMRSFASAVRDSLAAE